MENEVLYILVCIDKDHRIKDILGVHPSEDLVNTYADKLNDLCPEKRYYVAEVSIDDIFVNANTAIIKLTKESANFIDNSRLTPYYIPNFLKPIRDSMKKIDVAEEVNS